MAHAARVSPRRFAAIVVLSTVSLLTACGGGGHEKSPGGSETARPAPKPAKSKTSLAPSSCPAGSYNCKVARGRVVYVEAVDPDGDGDAHFVTVSRQSVTLPGITIFDVNKDLRPDPLPGVGDLVGGAGPVYRGHAGQRQIQVTEFHVAR